MKQPRTPIGAAAMETNAADEPRVMYDAVKEFFIEFARGYERGAAPRSEAILTGIRAFDDWVGGLVPGEVIALSGPPATGKTTLACELAAGVAAHGDGDRPRTVVLYVVTHGRAADIARRVVMTRAKLAPARMRRLRIAPELWDRLVEAADYCSQLRIWIDDRRHGSVADMIASARAHCDVVRGSAVAEQVRLIVVDDIPADPDVIAALRELAQNAGCAALAVLAQDDASPERLGVDAHVALCRVRAGVRAVLLYSRHTLTGVIPLDLPVPPAVLIDAEDDDDSEESEDERVRLQFARALADHLEATLHQFRVQKVGAWERLTVRHETWPPSSRVEIDFTSGDTPILELGPEVFLGDELGLRPLAPCDAVQRWGTPWPLDSPFTRRAGAWFCQLLDAVKVRASAPRSWG